MKPFKIFNLFFLTVLLLDALPTGRAPARDIKAPAGITYEVHQYRESEPKRAGQLCIAYPKQSKGRLPVVVFIHGGGWSKGDKDEAAWQAIRMAQSGYVGISIAYRLTHEAEFPACIEDAKEAIRYIKSIAGQIPGDMNRIGVHGYSAGAHLALMIGLTAGSESFKSNAYAEYDSSVNCVVAVAAPTGFVAGYGRSGRMSFLTEAQRNDLVFLKSISPVHWVHAKQPPILIMHGDADRVVSPVNYKNFARVCESVGVNNLTLSIFEGGDHLFLFKEGKMARPIADAFFNKHLK